MRLAFTAAVLTISLAGCGSDPNLKSAKDYHPPAPPAIAHPEHNPYAGYGEARATWRPPVVDRDGTVQKPTEPSSQYDRPEYENAPWATGAAQSPFGGPAGTF